MEQGRRADGRRIFAADFKREQIDRVERGEVTQAELARELGVQAGLIRRWRFLAKKGSEVAVQTGEAVVPASELRSALQRIQELERALGRKTMEVEILRAAATEVKKRPSYYGGSSR